jgi:hypothetical protein
VPRCYLLAVCSGSSLDQQSNNVTLFNLVEQLNIRPGAAPPTGLVPLEIHAYFEVSPAEQSFEFEVRFSMVASTGLETLSDPVRHKPTAARYRTRTIGLPFPPVVGQYHLSVDWRPAGSEQWHREPQTWPILIAEAAVRPRVTH